MKIYISNLSMSVEDFNLKAFFEQYGIVSFAKVIFNTSTGKSRGFGFVHMSKRTEGLEAIKALNGAVIDGKAMTVVQATEYVVNKNGNAW
jgi:RNA recognition motif-containing protein